MSFINENMMDQNNVYSWSGDLQRKEDSIVIQQRKRISCRPQADNISLVRYEYMLRQYSPYHYCATFGLSRLLVWEDT